MDQERTGPTGTDKGTRPTTHSSAKWRVAVGWVVRSHDVESSLHAVERIPSKGRGQPTQFVPVRFARTSKVTRLDRLLVVFDGFVLPKLIGREIRFSKIMYQGFVQHNLWADDADAETKIWSDFLQILSEIPDPVLIHYGHYESTFLSRIYGRGLQAWAVYQRITLRLSYRLIAKATQDFFHERIEPGVIETLVNQCSDRYAPAEALLLRQLLQSPVIHVDETKMSVLGVHQFVWVITDGSHVIFRLTETRETDFLRQLLAGFSGTLVSDFYGGYDSLPWRQQKWDSLEQQRRGAAQKRGQD